MFPSQCRWRFIVLVDGNLPFLVITRSRMFSKVGMLNMFHLITFASARHGTKQRSIDARKERHVENSLRVLDTFSNHFLASFCGGGVFPHRRRKRKIERSRDGAADAEGDEDDAEGSHRISFSFSRISPFPSFWNGVCLE